MVAAKKKINAKFCSIYLTIYNMYTKKEINEEC